MERWHWKGLEHAFINFSIAVHIMIQVALTLPDYHAELRNDQWSALNLVSGFEWIPAHILCTDSNDLPFNSLACSEYAWNHWKNQTQALRMSQHPAWVCPFIWSLVLHHWAHASITELLPLHPTSLPKENHSVSYIGRIITTRDRRKLLETQACERGPIHFVWTHHMIWSTSSSFIQQELEAMDLQICDSLIHILDSRDVWSSIRDLNVNET
jgi:hypothetical protein